jgi:hypothetical protein
VGIGKTAAAEARQRLTETGVLHAPRAALKLADRKALEEDLVCGDERLLRPELRMGRSRALKRHPDTLLEKFKQWAGPNQVPWAMTGAPAASRLQRFYLGEQIPAFLRTVPDRLTHDLNLLPDKNGSPCCLSSARCSGEWSEECAWRIPGSSLLNYLSEGGARP